MYIGVVVKKTGFSRDTIRFYKKMGLINLNHRDRYPNNYKNYSNDVVKRLLTIGEMKEFGFTLSEIKSILEHYKAGLFDCEGGKVTVHNKILEIDKKIEQLQNIRKRLVNTIRDYPEHCTVQKTLEKLETE